MPGQPELRKRSKILEFRDDTASATLVAGEESCLPEFINRLTPLVEVAWSSPSSRPNQGNAQYLISLGINYTAETDAVAVNRLIRRHHDRHELRVRRRDARIAIEFTPREHLIAVHIVLPRHDRH
jgi:hypothetical protein